MNPSNRIKIASLMLALCLLAPAGIAVAADSSSSSPGSAALDELEIAGEAAEYDTSDEGRDISTIIGNLIYQLLTIVGIIMVCLVIYSGFLWATAQGNTEQITKAKKILINAVIGLVIVFAAYAITYFIVESVSTATFGDESTT